MILIIWDWLYAPNEIMLCGGDYQPVIEEVDPHTIGRNSRGSRRSQIFLTSDSENEECDGDSKSFENSDPDSDEDLKPE